MVCNSCHKREYPIDLHTRLINYAYNYGELKALSNGMNTDALTFFPVRKAFDVWIPDA